MKTKAFAKINLNLHIHPQKKGEQFTPLTLINNQINLYDNLEFINQKNKIEIICFPKSLLPSNENNLVYQAAFKLKQFTQNPNLGVKIILTKNIPFPAGLGGGSSDAAATLKSLIKLWHIKINQSDIFKIADSLGKDVPYFLSSNFCKLTGFGNIPHSTKIKLPCFHLVIVYPEFSQKPSTGWMFQHLESSLINKNIFKLDLLVKAVKNKNADQIIENLHNDFESIVFKKFSETKDITSKLYQNGASKTLLAGSGLSIIGFFKNLSSAQKAFLKLKPRYSKIFLTQTI